MSATTRAPQARPPGAPAYYLGRPASWWLITLHQQPHQHRIRRAAAGPPGQHPPNAFRMTAGYFRPCLPSRQGVIRPPSSKRAARR